ncbi:hypothetical protein A4H97_07245 [Niastella yeongjuensis]|uniref:DUF1223 domain-containing protein n=1 Tax=Niastella yeongjuensis TaxID=354355 RepID=A0A1V9EMI3_9BACT|nr:DUF1223 domain-containing protein [Niastella yeongjuensis]OQP47291.1 hypothetical protein A4H97_07245 [Niastella yeongjuensis]SEN77391.1 hypothetical protein SAMN05660816_01473 [Niastella yeongjuensis]
MNWTKMKKIAGCVAISGVAVCSLSLNDVACQTPAAEKQERQLATGDNKGFALVELYTSEGCSSCPPADELMEKLQVENAGKPVYVVAFHVDYWNQLGWKDKFSTAAFTSRQRQYSDWMNLETIYTPQVVVNGVSEYVGSNERSIVKAIDASLNRGTDNALTLKGRVDSDKVQVAYEVTGSTKDKTLYLALVQKKASSNVKAGENEGRHLSHVQIVRELIPADISGKSTTVKLPENLQQEEWELIGFVQNKDNGYITAAAKMN